MKLIRVQKNDKMQNNSYLVINEENQCILIDTSYNDKELIEIIKKDKLELLAILITHGHYDHYGNSEELLDSLHSNAKIYINENEAPLIDLKLLSYRIRAIKEINVDFKKIEFFSNNASLDIGKFRIKTYVFPGHTPGSTSFEIDKWLFTGDFVFDKYIGVDFLPLSDPALMKQSCQKFIDIIPNHLLVMPGHYDSGVSAGYIKKNNRELLKNT
jgi:hydroxyacylglutathione hydrolase